MDIKIEPYVINLLQKKCQDLQHNNLILEINYLIEQYKNSELQSKIDELNKKLENHSKKKKKEDVSLDGDTF